VLDHQEMVARFHYDPFEVLGFLEMGGLALPSSFGLMIWIALNGQFLRHFLIFDVLVVRLLRVSS